MSAWNFNPRAPYGARRLPPRCRCSPAGNFNPRAPYGARHRPHTPLATIEIFQSSCPVRGTTNLNFTFNNQNWVFQSSCPVRGTTVLLVRDAPHGVISILVPRTGHDIQKFHAYYITETISILVPRTGHDARCWAFPAPAINFNPRAPYGARRSSSVNLQKNIYYFNPRAPYGARQSSPVTLGVNTQFQSSCPVRGTTSAASLSLP